MWWPILVSNDKLWKETNQENINIEIRRRKFRWIGHTLRKNDRETCKATLMWNPQCCRKKGSPKSSWWRNTLTEAGGAETYCQRQEKMEGTRRQNFPDRTVDIIISSCFSCSANR
jgi:hypothetical protein